MMSSALPTALALAIAVLAPQAVIAAPIYDFSNASTGQVTSLGSSATLEGGIVASAWYYNGTVWTASTLIARDETNDHGLGVCSEGSDACNIGESGGGDWNELSQLQKTEAILLERPDSYFWTGLWLSSLDNNDGSTSLGVENGTLYWGSTADIAALISGGSSTAFSFGAFGSLVEGELTLPAAFDPTAKYLLFLPGTGTADLGKNNDYLVWGAALTREEGDPAVPEPASLLLVGSGLLALARKRKQ